MTSKTETLTIKVELDTSDVQAKLEEINQAIIESKGFKVFSGEVYINDAFISDSLATENRKQSNADSYDGNITLRKNLSLIISKYLVGEAYEYKEELIDEILKATAQQDSNKKSDIESPRMRQIIREEMLMQMFPGGILSKFLATSRG